MKRRLLPSAFAVLPATVALLAGLVLLTGCTEETTLGGEEVDTDYNLEGMWDGETESGRLFLFRMAQKGAVLTGDVTVDSTKAGMAGRINGDAVSLEANLSPAVFFDAELSPDGRRMLNGRVSDASGAFTERFAAVKR